MSKLVAAGTAALGGTATVVGGSYILQKGVGTGTGNSPGAPGTNVGNQVDTNSQGDKGSGGDVSGKQTPDNETKLEFESLDEFTQQPNKSTCVSTYFQGLTAKADAKEITATEPTSTDFFKTGSEGKSSCLKMEYKKTSYKESKGSGKFTGLGTFATENEGFISFNMAETDDTENTKLKFTGIFYLVGKNGENGEIKYKKSINGDKKTDKDELDKHFPKPTSDLPEVTTPYGGFISNQDDLKNMCFGSGCQKEEGKTNPTVDKKEFTWTKGDDKSKSLKEWAENLTWGTTLYTDNHGNLDSKINVFKGNGTKKTT